MGSRILFVDDDGDFADPLARALNRRDAGFEIVNCYNAEDALELSESQVFDAAICDLSLDESGPEGGIKLVRALGASKGVERVIVLTGSSEEKLGIEALSNGAASFIVKPPDIDHLFHLLVDAVKYSKLKRERDRDSNPENTLGVRSQNLAMRQTLSDAAFAASTNQPVFIIGETGTGKGILTKAIHSASSRKKGQLVRCQPSFSNPDIVSSELFGHVKGAFTGADREKEGLIRAADRGTLFIDEIDQLPKETQVILLNTLQEGEFRKVGSTREERSDFRLISASNLSELELFEGDKLRPDFLHRIAHLIIRIPPLRQRPEDIGMLAEEFLQKACDAESLKLSGLSPSSYSKLHSYNWPGNVRELQSAVSAAAAKAVFKKRAFVEPEDFDFNIEGASSPRKSEGTFREQVQRFERQLVEQALANTEGNQSEAARSLGMDRASFRRVLGRK